MIKTVGVFAHVDAGKTTFSERALFLSGAIRHLGRVDHQDAFLDAHPLEKQRGITIFSGQARLNLFGDELRLLDTPGHVDFSPEMERAMSAIDYAILLVSAAEGVQSHAETLWRLLKEYGKPVFVFLNKLDREGADAEGCIQRLRALSPDMIDMRSLQAGAANEPLIEELASRDERLLGALFSTGYDEKLWLDAATELIAHRRLFPVFAGSALTGEGVERFLRFFVRLSETRYEQIAAQPVSALCYQVRRGAEGEKLCFLKLLSGTLRVKDELTTLEGARKVNEIRLYHGERYQTASVVRAGELATVPQLEGVRAGDVVGAAASERAHSHTQPMLSARLCWDDSLVPANEMLRALRLIEEEEPTLSVESAQGAVSLRVMGKIQLEVLQTLLLERFGYRVTFGEYRVLYQETVRAPSVGVGHYEPLRHYAEVHLRLRPAPRGSGVTFVSLCHVDDLTLNWQRLIQTHVLEKTHRGVLTGAPLTDVQIELLSGRAHLKHTEGGDFRQATYRAIRNALMYADNLLLEPVCRYALTLPREAYGRVTGDLIAMGAEMDAPEYAQETVCLRGLAVYALMQGYQEKFLSITHGRGGFSAQMAYYAPCRDQDAVVKAAAYNPLADDTPDSVFCQKGAGYAVPWNEVRAHAHLPVEEA